VCLGLPGRVVSVVTGDGTARVEVAGVVREIDVSQLTGSLAPGEYLLVHSGYALERLSAERAAEVLTPFSVGSPDSA
jgi:hydrogenase expression/formation protein HypC